jgi:hypothetical protein
VDQNSLTSLDRPVLDIKQLLSAILSIGKLDSVELDCHCRLSVS